MDAKRHASADEDVINRVAGQSKRGKKLKVGQHNSGMYFITWADGGQVPLGLKGKYTSYAVALNDVKQYLGGK